MYVINYDELLSWLKFQETTGRTFEYVDDWTCECPVARFAVEKLNCPDGSTHFFGDHLIVDNEVYIVDNLIARFVERIDDLPEMVIPAKVAVAILETVV